MFILLLTHRLQAEPPTASPVTSWTSSSPRLALRPRSSLAQMPMKTKARRYRLKKAPRLRANISTSGSHRGMPWEEQGGPPEHPVSTLEGFDMRANKQSQGSEKISHLLPSKLSSSLSRTSSIGAMCYDIHIYMKLRMYGSSAASRYLPSSGWALAFVNGLSRKHVDC